MAVSNINLSRVNISLAEFQRMSDDFFAYGVPMQILALDAVPGLMDKIQAFFAREDVKALDFESANGPGANAESLRYALDRAAELPVESGNAGKDI